MPGMQICVKNSSAESRAQFGIHRLYEATSGHQDQATQTIKNAASVSTYTNSVNKQNKNIKSLEKSIFITVAPA